jgi:hypothetical protein
MRKNYEAKDVLVSMKTVICSAENMADTKKNGKIFPLLVF